MTQLVMRIAARRDGFRRAGLAHPKAAVDHSIFDFTREQIGALESEPLLSVQYLDLARPEIPGQPTFDELLAAIQKAVAEERAAEERAAAERAAAETAAAEQAAAAEAAARQAEDDAAAAREAADREAAARESAERDAAEKAAAEAGAGGGTETAPAAKRGKKAEAKA